MSLISFDRLTEIAARHRDEIDREADRSKQSQSHLERTHQARERAHKQRVRGLEEQVCLLFLRFYFLVSIYLHYMLCFH